MKDAKPCFPITTVAPLLPHAGNMVLLDEILYCDDARLLGRAAIRSDHVFLQQDSRVPVWMAMEILAQGIAAFDGFHAAAAGCGPRLGFLLGSRQLSLYADRLPVGAQLQLEVLLSTHGADGFGVFDGRLDWLNPPAPIQARLPGGTRVAQGLLSVYQPGQSDTVAALIGIQGE